MVNIIFVVYKIELLRISSQIFYNNYNYYYFCSFLQIRFYPVSKIARCGEKVKTLKVLSPGCK
jgi:hypothetical protein